MIDCLSVTLTDEDQQFSQVKDEKALIRKRPEKWTVDDVCQWVTELGLEQYEPSFRGHHIDGQELAHLDDNALQKHLGIGMLDIFGKLLGKFIIHNHLFSVQKETSGWLNGQSSQLQIMRSWIESC